MSRAIYDGMVDSDPQAVWVLQGWAFMFNRQFWTQPRIEAFLDAVPDDRMVVLDLFCESRPMWNETEAFCGKPWLWCNIQNFGNTVFLGGPLNKIAADLPAARRDPDSGRLVGLGFVNEGLGLQPGGPRPDVRDGLARRAAWTWRPGSTQYAHHRYGRANAGAARAWQQLLSTVYGGPGECPFDHRPHAHARAAVRRGTSSPHWPKRGVRCWKPPTNWAAPTRTATIW